MTRLEISNLLSSAKPFPSVGILASPLAPSIDQTCFFEDSGAPSQLSADHPTRTLFLGRRVSFGGRIWSSLKRYIYHETSYTLDFLANKVTCQIILY